MCRRFRLWDAQIRPQASIEVNLVKNVLWHDAEVIDALLALGFANRHG